MGSLKVPSMSGANYDRENSAKLSPHQREERRTLLPRQSDRLPRSKARLDAHHRKSFCRFPLPFQRPLQSS